MTPTRNTPSGAVQKEYRAAESAGTGAISVDGQLVDAAHMRHVEIVLDRAAKAGQI
jgi:citrate lyase subunit beta / citryl-CoA lyase